jgi:hypothetical protein
MMIRKIIPVGLLLLVASAIAKDSHPPCFHSGTYHESVAYGFLKNEGWTDPNSPTEAVDFSKTTNTRLSSVKISEKLYRQIHLVTFTKKNGESIEVITDHVASWTECSEDGADLYIIKKSRKGYHDEGLKQTNH